jgi:hypothetical protein
MKFIHFGCWNNGLCSAEGTNGLSYTMKKLNSYIQLNPISFITIAGDNYYPQKISSGKIFNTEHFASGFNCLPKDIKKYLIFGNHDIEDVVKEGDGEEEIKCKLLDEQIKLVDDDNTIEIFNDVLFKIIDKTLIIMLDTNLYDREIINTPINETCYSRLFVKLVNKSGLTIGDLISYQNCFIRDILKTHPDMENIILIGHHPIYSIKNKKGKKDEIKSIRFIDFLKQISSFLIGKKVYYLCADTHMYQSGVVNILPDLAIEQYIVGTGGAEQDNIYSGNNTVVENGSIVYTKTNEKKEFGFLMVEINESNVSCNFISANPVMIGGYNKKYKIVKNKLIKFL